MQIVAVLASEHDCVLSGHLPLVCDWFKSMCDTQIMVHASCFSIRDLLCIFAARQMCALNTACCLLASLVSMWLWHVVVLKFVSTAEMLSHFVLSTPLNQTRASSTQPWSRMHEVPGVSFGKVGGVAPLQRCLRA